MKGVALFVLAALLIYILFVRKSSPMLLAPIRMQRDITSDDGYLNLHFQSSAMPGQGPQASYNMVPGEF